MSSTPTSLFNSDSIFSPELYEIPPTESPKFCEIIPPPSAFQENVEATLLWNNQDIFPSLENGSINNCNTLMIPSNDTSLSSFFGGVSSFPQQHGVTPIFDVMEPAEPTSLLDYDIGCCNSASACGVVHQYHHKSVEESLQFQQPATTTLYDNELINKKYYEGFGSNYQAVYFGDPNSHNSVNWEIQGNSSIQSSSVEEPAASTTKVRRYSEEERKNRILKYLKKRNQRNFNKTIKYACRKTLADRRIRIRGRFARNNEVGEEPESTKKTNNHQEDDEYNNEGSETKSNEETEWLQEAITNLMYLPIFAA